MKKLTFPVTFKQVIALNAAGLFAGSIAFATTVVVTPSNMNGWTFEATDNNGNTPTPTDTPYYNAVGQIVAPPAPPPSGPNGSAQLETAPNGGDGASEISIASFDGQLLSSITALSYATYDVANNGQQFPYIQIAVSTDGSDSLASEDILFFEPPYQTPSTGGPLVQNQGATIMNQWQLWNAMIGGWWDNNIVLYDPTLYNSPTSPNNPAQYGGGYGLVNTLAAFLALYPNATIMDNPYPGNGDGGISFTVGYGSPTDNYNGYVDDITIGTAAGSTTYEFEPGSSSVPDSGATAALLGCALAGLGVFSRRKIAGCSVKA